MTSARLIVSVCNVVHCGSHGLVTRAKSYTNLLLAGKFLSVQTH